MRTARDPRSAPSPRQSRQMRMRLIVERRAPMARRCLPRQALTPHRRADRHRLLWTSRPLLGWRMLSPCPVRRRRHLLARLVVLRRVGMTMRRGGLSSMLRVDAPVCAVFTIAVALLEVAEVVSHGAHAWDVGFLTVQGHA